MESAHQSTFGAAGRDRRVLNPSGAGDGVAKRLRLSQVTVCKWRGRFMRDRLDGLYDEPRPGPRAASGTRRSSR